MKCEYLRRALGIGALALAGCRYQPCINQPRDHNIYADLNRDKKEEIITETYRHRPSPYWGYRYKLSARFSNPDGSYGEPKLLMEGREPDSPIKIEFTDSDRDGDLDLVFSRCDYGLWDWYGNYNTYVAKNDGKGNFGEPELKKTVEPENL